MSKLHEIKARVSEAAGLSVLDCDEGVYVFVTGDQPETVPVVAARLKAANIPFAQSKHTKFKGGRFIVPLKNVGTAFHADWEFA